MDAAKSAVKKFTSRDGHHDTSVQESVAPAVQNETVERPQHEKVTTAVDREVHQDHYHTTEQPVHHSETLPEQHHHRAIPVEHRSHEHDNKDTVERKLAEERGKYRDSQRHVDGEQTTSANPTVAGEHVHHHVHENIQPVVQKQTIEPHVVHTTVPIHEVHHNESQHHAASSLPPMSMEEFKNKGGSLKGREERRDHFEGCPPEGIAGHKPQQDVNEGSTGRGLAGGAAAGGAAAAAGHHQRNGRDELDESNLEGRRSNADPARSAATTAAAGSGYQQSPSVSSTHSKPSLLDKLNPKKDADGDGKAGFMK